MRGLTFLVELLVLIPFIVGMIVLVRPIHIDSLYKMYTLNQVHDAILHCYSTYFTMDDYSDTTCAKALFSLYCDNGRLDTYLTEYEVTNEICSILNGYGAGSTYINVYGLDTRMDVSLYTVKDPYEFLSKNVRYKYVGTIVCGGSTGEIVYDGPYPKEGEYLCTYWVVSGSKGDCDAFLFEICV